MSKAMIITLLLLALSVGGVTFAASDIHEACDKVVITENKVFGNIAAVKGLTMELNSTYNNHLFWRASYIPGGNSKTETEYTFSATKKYEEGKIYYDGVYIYIPDYSYDFDSFDSDEPPAGIALAYHELAEATEPGKSSEKVIYLADYLDYYPFPIGLNFPHKRAEIGFGRYFISPESEEDIYALKKLQDYFKIPVLPDERYEIGIEKDENGRIVGTHSGSAEKGDAYYIITYSVLTDSACYFTFNTHSQEDKVMDTSELPDGYGIYRLPYEDDKYDERNQLTCGVNPDALRMVYPLSPEISVVSLNLNPEKTRLLLHTVENEKYVLTVIDINTMTEVQRLVIADFQGKEAGWIRFDEDDFMALILSGLEKLAVITHEKDGSYRLQYTCDFKHDNIPRFPTWNLFLDFDGERLAMTGMLPDNDYGTYATCNFFLAVYDKTGPVYYGEYKSSLSTGKNPSNYSYHCRGFDHEPIRIVWENNS